MFPSKPSAFSLLLPQLAWIVVAGGLFVVCLVMGINLGVPVLLLISACFFNLFLHASADKNALEHSINSNFNLSDLQNGQWVAIQGSIRPLVPGSDRALPNIMAYHFRILAIKHRIAKRSIVGREASNGHQFAKRLYDGFYLIPIGISSARGNVKLRAFPDLTSLEKSSVPDEVFARAESLAMAGLSLLPAFLQRARVVAAVSDKVDTTIKYLDRRSEGPSLGEYMQLRNRDEICIFGRWQDGALIADKRRPKGLPVYKDSAEKRLSELKQDARAFNAAGIFFAALSMGLLAWSLLF